MDANGPSQGKAKGDPLGTLGAIALRAWGGRSPWGLAAGVGLVLGLTAIPGLAQHPTCTNFWVDPDSGSFTCLDRQPEFAPRGTPAAPAAAGAAGTSDAIRQASGTLVTRVPILDRRSGIPVIAAQFGSTVFPMMLDTGASTTVITQDMAAALGIEPDGVLRGNTPSQRGVEFPAGRASTVTVGEIVADSLPVAISDQLDVGLLGQNFFGEYDLAIRSDAVEFYAR